MDSILSLLQLSADQTAAVLAEEPAIVVTAGAGSGKTRTLAGRYLRLLEQGQPLRSLAAVTFTEKAAREMRSRIRHFIDLWRRQVASLPDRAGEEMWARAFGELDAARIGTIHSLCAAILRAHPVEAGVDPAFAVLDENTAALLQARAAEEALAWAIDDPLCSQLFGPVSEHRLRQTIAALLAGRLDAMAAFAVSSEEPLAHWSAELADWLNEQLEAAGWQQALADLAALQARTADDKLELARQEVLSCWASVKGLGVSSGRSGRTVDWNAAIAGLQAMRKAIKSNVGAKGNWNSGDLEAVRAAMRGLAALYDERLRPLTGKALDWQQDAQAAALLPALRQLFAATLEIYEGFKAEGQALDFDDLEHKAAQLLSENRAVADRWQQDVTAVLVDEFQDTNDRQRRIIYALVGFGARPKQAWPGSGLLIVGDAKQSIYRFRGADVTVFRQAQADVQAAGGRQIDLDTTYRGHSSLVETLNALLAPILGQRDDPQQPFRVPFAPLRAGRVRPERPTGPPFLEFHLGLTQGAETGRLAAAAALAGRLRELHEHGWGWGEMALLFRASSGFVVYEDALERAGIPFVTVAGRGFYDRPEVRDVLNVLAAIADPTDDLALAGLLRSPMFGLSDGALYVLRRGAGPKHGRPGLWQALNDDDVLAALDPADAERARRGRRVVADLRDLAGRATVAEVLKRLLDSTHYRAAVRLAGVAPRSERAWRNIDKLLADAHRSQLVSIGDFLEYVQSLRDVAAREGEAPSEASSAVQLMTVHKAKGLEFPLVVIADAARRPRSSTPSLLLDRRLGVLLSVADPEGEQTRPIAYQLAALRQQAMDEAEERRLVYVAATRAKELLLISGQARISTAKNDPGRLLLEGWLSWLGQTVGMADVRVDLEACQSLELAWDGGPVSCQLYAYSEPPEQDLAGLPGMAEPAAGEEIGPSAGDLAAPLRVDQTQAVESAPERDGDAAQRVWRVVAKTATPRAPNWVVGVLVHQALRRWRFPSDDGFEQFLWPYAVEAGLVDAVETAAAIGEAGRLLARLQAHALYRELAEAERYHELPFDVAAAGRARRGIVDLLVRVRPGVGWRLYDFKTDELGAAADLAEHARRKGYDRQVRAYVAALAGLLGEQPESSLVFLNAGGQVAVLPLSGRQVDAQEIALAG